MSIYIEPAEGFHIESMIFIGCSVWERQMMHFGNGRYEEYSDGVIYPEIQVVCFSLG
jgi:hypothetical protein